MPFAILIHIIVFRQVNDVDQLRANAFAGSARRPVVRITGNPKLRKSVLQRYWLHCQTSMGRMMSSAMGFVHVVANVASVQQNVFFITQPQSYGPHHLLRVVLNDGIMLTPYGIFSWISRKSIDKQAC